MDDSLLTLGPYELTGILGQGGMGQVWSARHVGQDVPLALKLISEDRSADPAFRRALRNEVRAVARLQHPGIVMVFDSGEVPAEVAAASGGRLSAGWPYLVMERASQGTLKELARPIAWGPVRRMLLQLLDALV